MIKTTTTISNKLGLHARASAKLTKLAGSFACEVWMSRSARPAFFSAAITRLIWAALACMAAAAVGGWLTLCADRDCGSRMVGGKAQPLDASRGYADVGIRLAKMD